MMPSIVRIPTHTHYYRIDRGSYRCISFLTLHLHESRASESHEKCLPPIVLPTLQTKSAISRFVLWHAKLMKHSLARSLTLANVLRAEVADSGITISLALHDPVCERAAVSTQGRIRACTRYVLSFDLGTRATEHRGRQDHRTLERVPRGAIRRVLLRDQVAHDHRQHQPQARRLAGRRCNTACSRSHPQRSYV